MKKTLLLNSGYQPLSFIPFKKAVKLIFKEKVDIIADWEENIFWTNGNIRYPSVLRLKIEIKRNFFNTNFSRKILVKRDHSNCQYCGEHLSPSKVTIDHVLPRCQGGLTSFSNCVVSCFPCNGRKGDKTPEQAGMKLLKKPMFPSLVIQHAMDEPEEFWNNEWDNYLTKH